MPEKLLFPGPLATLVHVDTHHWREGGREGGREGISTMHCTGITKIATHTVHERVHREEKQIKNYMYIYMYSVKQAIYIHVHTCTCTCTVYMYTPTCTCIISYRDKANASNAT